MESMKIRFKIEHAINNINTFFKRYMLKKSNRIFLNLENLD